MRHERNRNSIIFSYESISSSIMQSTWRRWPVPFASARMELFEHDDVKQAVSGETQSLIHHDISRILEQYLRRTISSTRQFLFFTGYRLCCYKAIENCTRSGQREVHECSQDAPAGEGALQESPHEHFHDTPASGRTLQETPLSAQKTLKASYIHCQEGVWGFDLYGIYTCF